MKANPAAENILGTLGAICWSIQVIPQIWKSWREKSTEGLSSWLVLIWGISSFPLGVYAIVQDLNIPLIIQPQLFGFLTLVSWGQCQYYGRNRSRIVAVLMVSAMVLAMASFEIAMVYVSRPSYEQGSRASVTFFGILSCALISLGMVLQYLEIYRHNEVVGVSMLFMGIDMLGGLFSNLSLVFKPKFDVLAGVAYTLVIVLDGIVVVCAVVLNPRARNRRRHENRLDASSVISSHDTQRGPLKTGDTPTTLRPLSIHSN